MKGSPLELLNSIEEKKVMEGNKICEEALKEMRLLFEYCECFQVLDSLVFDLSLARGLNYYTGIIFEAVLTDTKLHVGSIGGGGNHFYFYLFLFLFFFIFFIYFLFYFFILFFYFIHFLKKIKINRSLRQLDPNVRKEQSTMHRILSGSGKNLRSVDGQNEKGKEKDKCMLYTSVRSSTRRVRQRKNANRL